MNESQLNPEVTKFLDAQHHPLRSQIEELRELIICSCPGLSENIKWNGPNYSFNGTDCVTMRIQPPKKLQVIFHRGAKVKPSPGKRLVDDDVRLVEYKADDRAVCTFNNAEEISTKAKAFQQFISKWVLAVES